MNLTLEALLSIGYLRNIMKKIKLDLQPKVETVVLKMVITRQREPYILQALRGEKVFLFQV